MMKRWNDFQNRLFAFDLEGTLSEKSGRVTSPALIKILAQLESTGNALLLCSGRDREYLVDWKRRHGLRHDSPFVTENGCVVVYDGKVYLTFEPAKFDRERIIEMLSCAGILEIGEFDPKKQFVVTIYPRGFSDGKDYSLQQVRQLFERVKEILKDIECTIMFTSASAEITPDGISKATGLKKFCELSRTNPAALVYFCDGNNDVPAAEFVKEHGGLVAVPANAVPELKKIADFVATKKFDDGTLEILSEMLSVR
jgi:HAD superfamily hydrolase (TIGR01484 family)